MPARKFSRVTVENDDSAGKPSMKMLGKSEVIVNTQHTKFRKPHARLPANTLAAHVEAIAATATQWRLALG